MPTQRTENYFTGPRGIAPGSGLPPTTGDKTILSTGKHNVDGIKRVVVEVTGSPDANYTIRFNYLIGVLDQPAFLIPLDTADGITFKVKLVPNPGATPRRFLMEPFPGVDGYFITVTGYAAGTYKVVCYEQGY